MKERSMSPLDRFRISGYIRFIIDATIGGVEKSVVDGNVVRRRMEDDRIRFPYIEYEFYSIYLGALGGNGV